MRLPVICEKTGLNKGAWTSEEDELLSTYIRRYGPGNWGKLPKHAGLNRTGKSCRLRWLNYLRPDLKKGSFAPEEEELVHNLHQQFGNSWCRIAARLPGRSDNEIKNYWHTSRKNRSAPNKATQKTKSFLQEDRDLVDLETSSFGLMRPQKSCDLSNEVVVMKVSIADERKPEYDAAAWPDLVELESMLETITSLEKYDGENDFECDHPDDNITTVLDFPFPVTPPRSEGFFSPFVLNNTNQPTEDAVIFAEPDSESDGHFWNEMLLMSQNLDMAFVLAEAWLLPPSQPQPPEEALHEYPYFFYNGYHG